MDRLERRSAGRWSLDDLIHADITTRRHSIDFGFSVILMTAAVSHPHWTSQIYPETIATVNPGFSLRFHAARRLGYWYFAMAVSLLTPGGRALERLQSSGFAQPISAL